MNMDGRELSGIGFAFFFVPVIVASAQILMRIGDGQHLYGT